MKEYTLGIDIGTSGVKTGLLDLSNYELVAIASRGYKNTSRQNTDKIWKMTIEAIKESVSKFIEKFHINAIGLSGQMHGTVFYDNSGEIIGPIINWQDDSCNKPIEKYRGKTTIEKIVELLDSEDFDDLGIDTMASGFFGATLFYIRENHKSFFNRIKHAVLPTDFIRGKLLGKCDYSTDQTNAFSTGLFNTKQNKWHSEFIKRLRLSEEIFPMVCYTSEIAGYISNEVADMLKTGRGIPLIYGGGDNQMSILGTGLITPDSPPLINIGTGAQISKIIGKYKKINGVDTRSFFDGNFALVGASLGGGKSYRSLKNEIKESEGIDISFPEMDTLASNVEPLCDGLRFYTGASRRKPNRNAGFSKNIKHPKGIGHRARAVMEAIVLELHEYYSLFGKNKHTSLMAAGNALQNSTVWSQIVADIFGKIVHITNFENAVFGAALMAAKGISAVKSIEEVHKKIKYSMIYPDKENVEIYRREFNLK